jgi:hypothetical protein
MMIAEAHGGFRRGHHDHEEARTLAVELPSARLKATNARFTALSISSMDMKIVMMLRLKMNATTPRPNRTALSTR